MRIVICDDEVCQVNKLCDLVQKVCAQQNVTADIRPVTSYKRFLEDVAKVRADIVLLDICLGSDNGIEAARILRRFNVDCVIIFITSSPDYALDAFEVTAAHYILKPVSFEKLQTALLRSRFFQAPRPTLELVVDYMPLQIPLTDILYLETVDRKTRLHLRNGNLVDCNLALAHLSEQLPPAQFLACYRGLLINADYVQSLDETGLTLSEQLKLPISSKRYSRIRSQYHEYLILKVRTAHTS